MDLTRAVNTVVDAFSGQYTPEHVLEILDIAAPVIGAQTLRSYADELEANGVNESDPSSRFRRSLRIKALRSRANKLDPQ